MRNKIRATALVNSQGLAAHLNSPEIGQKYWKISLSINKTSVKTELFFKIKKIKKKSSNLMTAENWSKLIPVKGYYSSWVYIQVRRG